MVSGQGLSDLRQILPAAAEERTTVPDAKHLGASEDQPDKDFLMWTAELTEDQSTATCDQQPAPSPEPGGEVPVAPPVPSPTPPPPENPPVPKVPAPPAPSPADAVAPVHTPHAAPVPRPVVELPQPTPRVPVVRTPPPEPTKPQYGGEKAFSGVYWLVIVVGFVGQIVGFGKLFGGTLSAYLVAVIIGGAFELVMVSFGDKALAMRVDGYETRQWIPFLLASAISAVIAAAINLHHWSSVDITAAAIIGGTAFFGYIGHTFSGFVAGTKYKRERAARDKVRLEIAAEQRREADALRKQEEKRLRETTQAADPGPARPSSPPPPVTVTATARQPARDKPRTKPQSSTSGTERSEKRRLKKEIALPWMLDQPQRPGPAEVNRHFEKQGYAPVDKSTVRRWWPENGPRPESTRDAGSAST